MQTVFAPKAWRTSRAAAAAFAPRPHKHRGWLLALFAGALIFGFALPKAPLKAQPVAAGDAAVLAADNALGEALRAGDRSAARRLLALQFSFVDANGKYYARKDFLGDLKGLAAAPASDAKVRSYGLLVAITGHRRSALNLDVFFLDIWARQKGAWRALARQDVAVAAADTPGPAVPAAAAGGEPYECKNPCQSVPYRIRSAPEQEVVAAFEVLEKAIVDRDSTEYDRHVADEFVVYRSRRPPAGKSGRMAAINRQRESNAIVTVGAVERMRLAVYDDAAAMMTDDVTADKSRRYRSARLWTKRNGQWLLAISVQTDVK